MLMIQSVSKTGSPDSNSSSQPRQLAKGETGEGIFWVRLGLGYSGMTIAVELVKKCHHVTRRLSSDFNRMRNAK